jgi:hypothetical protein
MFYRLVANDSRKNTCFFFFFICQLATFYQPGRIRPELPLAGRSLVEQPPTTPPAMQTFISKNKVDRNPSLSSQMTIYSLYIFDRSVVHPFSPNPQQSLTIYARLGQTLHLRVLPRLAQVPKAQTRGPRRVAPSSQQIALPGDCD